MSYNLEFHPDALDEWNKLTKHIKEQFKKVLERRLKSPHVPKAKLHNGLKGCYKIKLLKGGFRLVYKVNDEKLILTIIAVGKRENNYVYNLAGHR